MRGSDARGEKPSRGVQRVDFEWHMPRRRNFLSEYEYKFASCVWILIMLGALSFAACQGYWVFSRWDTLDFSLSEMPAADYKGPRLPFLDVCEDRGTSIKSVDSPNPPFVLNSSKLTPEITADCRYFLNGVASAGIGDTPFTAGRTYYEISPRSINKPRVLREGTEMAGSASVGQYACYRFKPPKLEKPLQPDDRVLIKWQVAIDGTVPEGRLSKRGGTFTGITGLLYRVSLAEHEHTPLSLAEHVSLVLKAAMHQLKCTRNVIVSGRVHTFRWVNWFGSITEEMNTFDLTNFDAESGCFGKETVWQKGTPIRSTLNLRIDYTSNAIAMTVWRSDNLVRLMIGLSSIIAVFSLLKFVGLPFVSVVKTEQDVLRLTWPCSGRHAEEEEEEAPLLDQQ